MHLTCRRQDQSTFEALGFVPDFEQSPDSPVIEMADEQANYAHCNELPTIVPFTAWHSAGSNYGDGLIACKVDPGHVISTRDVDMWSPNGKAIHSPDKDW